MGAKKIFQPLVQIFECRTPLTVAEGGMSTFLGPKITRGEDREKLAGGSYVI